MQKALVRKDKRGRKGVKQRRKGLRCMVGEGARERGRRSKSSKKAEVIEMEHR